MVVEVVGEAFWVFLPCYMANMAPVGAGRLLPHWNAPLDGGRMARDGRPLLGPHKTWRGVTAAMVAGAVTTVLLAGAASGRWPSLDFHRSGGASWPGIALFGSALGLGVIVGDALKSLLKRRLGRASGQPWPPWDQLDMVPTAFLAAWLAAPLIGAPWVRGAYFDGPWAFLVVLIATPALHWGSSVAAHKLGLKSNPW